MSGFCPSTRTFAVRFFQTPSRDGSPCVFASPSPPSGWAGDFHPQAAEDAQHASSAPFRGLTNVAGFPRLTPWANLLRSYGALAPENAGNLHSPETHSDPARGIDVSCDLIRGGNEAESPRVGLSLQSGQIARLALLLELFRSTIHPCLAFGEEAVDDTSQVPCHRLDCFRGSKSCPEAPVARTQVAVAAQQGDGRHSQNAGHPVWVFPVGVPDHFSTADIAFGAQAQPGGEVLFGRPPVPQFRTQLCHHGLDRHEIHSLNADGVHPGDSFQLRAKIERLRSVSAPDLLRPPLLFPWRGRRRHGPARIALGGPPGGRVRPG